MIAFEQIIQENKFLKDISPIIIDKILSEADHISFNTNDFIYKENDKAANLYMILEGFVKIGHTTPDNKKVLKVIMQKGEVFGVLNLLGQRYRKNFAIAKSKCQLFSVPINLVENILANDPQTHLEIIKRISKNLIEHEEKMESRQYLSAEERVLEWLKDVALDKGKQLNSGHLVIQFNYSQTEIAALTGTSRQTVCAVLSKYKSSGYINFDNKYLTIFDINAL